MINIEEKTKIYLVENCYGDPFKIYIGKTKGSREINHKITFGKEITYVIIDEINSLKKEDWIPLEKFWINYFLFLGFNVQNKNEGGAGVEFCSEEHKMKISKANKGRKDSKETIEKRRKSKLGKPNPFSEKHLENFLKAKAKPVIQKNLDGIILNEFNSMMEAAKYIFTIYNNKYPLINIASGISLCCRRKTKTAYKFKWEYK